MRELQTLARSAQRLLWITHPEDALSLFHLSAIPEALQEGQNLWENGDRISRVSFGPIERYPFCLEVDVLSHQARAISGADSGSPHKFHQISRVLGLRIELLSSDVLHDGLKLLPIRRLPNRLLGPEKFEAGRRRFAERARLERDGKQVPGETDVLIEADFPHSRLVLCEPEFQLRGGDVLHGHVETLLPGSFENIQDARAGRLGLVIELLKALLIKVQQFGQRQLRRFRINPALFFLLLLQLPFGEFPVAGFEAFPNQLAVDSEDRIIA